MIIRRVGKSTVRLTKGKAYTVYDSNYIKDDNGDPMSPSLYLPAYWQIIDRGNSEFYTKVNHPEKETTMLEIEIGAVVINGKSAKQYTTDQLIKMIQDEEDKIETLNIIKVYSKAINTLRIKHKTNITAIASALDSLNEE